MPCNSDYLEPNSREIELRRAAKLLLFCYRQFGVKGITQELEDAAKDCYCRADYVSDLCEFLTDLKRRSIVNFDKFVYNGKNKNCRDLADWWEEHQAADRERVKKENQLKEQNRLRKSALAKLTPAERNALRV